MTCVTKNYACDISGFQDFINRKQVEDAAKTNLNHIEWLSFKINMHNMTHK